jgi:hypothetical protein
VVETEEGNGGVDGFGGEFGVLETCCRGRGVMFSIIFSSIVIACEIL